MVSKIALPFSIVPWIREISLNQRFSVSLVTPFSENNCDSSFNFDDLFPFRNGTQFYSGDIESKIVSQFKSVPDYCSMALDSFENLLDHVQNIYTLGYMHYLYGLQNSEKTQFPKNACEWSSANLYLNLLYYGYSNAVLIGNSEQNHCYVGLPFVLDSSFEKGFVIVDPTSDQLFASDAHAPRNLVFVSKGQNWSYVTDWRGGVDLFPGVCSEISHLGSLRNNSSRLYGIDFLDNYFRRVFENPVSITASTIEDRVKSYS